MLCNKIATCLLICGCSLSACFQSSNQKINDVEAAIEENIRKEEVAYKKKCKAQLLRKIIQQVDSALLEDPKFLEFDQFGRKMAPPKPIKPKLKQNFDSLEIKELILDSILE